MQFEADSHAERSDCQTAVRQPFQTLNGTATTVHKSFGTRARTLETPRKKKSSLLRLLEESGRRKQRNLTLSAVSTEDALMQ